MNEGVTDMQRTDQKPVHKQLMMILLVIGIVISGVALAADTKGQELTIAYGLDPDVHSAKGTGEMLLKIFCGDRLVELAGDDRIRPSLAASWQVKENGREIIFQLRKDVKFSDGTPFTADAVKFTYDRIINTKNTSWTEADRIAKIEVLGPHTIAFYFKPNLEGFIALTSFAEYHCTIVSPNSVSPKGEALAPMADFVGTGPWKVAEYKKDQYTVFVPNGYYHGKKPILKKVTLKVIPKAEARVLAIQSGDVDAVVDYYHGGSAYTPRNLLRTLQSQGFRIYKKELSMTVVLACNFEKTPWNQLTVRRGLNYAVNKDDIAALFDGWLTPAKTRMFPDSAPYMKESGEQEYAFDPKEARKLFKKAGLSKANPVSLIAQGQNPDEVKLCELIKSQLEQAGLSVALDVLEPGLYKERRNKNAWDLRIYYIGGPERRKYTRIDGRFNPEAPEFSFGYFCSPELTPVLKQAVGSFNAAERRKNFKIFYNKAQELAAGVPLYYEAVFVVAKPKVKNIRYISSEPRFDAVYIGK
jgi:ABC-type transport system substrate-binding protein